MKRRLIIFAKEPRAGKVKTRLARHLTASRSAELYKAFLKDTLDLTKNVPCDEKIIAYDAKDGRPVYLKEIAGSDFKFYRQKGKDLGEKMHNASLTGSKGTNYKTVIIGSDAPTVPPRFIKEAFERLGKTSVVLGPSNDGGYYLIGLKEPCAGLFKNIKWSSGTVLRDTIVRAKTHKKRISLLDRWYDVDDKKGLARLKKDLKNKKRKNRAPWTKRSLKI